MQKQIRGVKEKIAEALYKKSQRPVLALPPSLAESEQFYNFINHRTFNQTVKLSHQLMNSILDPKVAASNQEETVEQLEEQLKDL